MKFENRGKWLQEAEDKLAAYDTQEHPDFLDGDDKVLTMEDGDDEELMNFEEDELDVVEEDDTLDSPEEEEDALMLDESSQKNEVWTDIYGILGDIGEKRYFNKQKELSRADMEKEFRKALKIKGLKPTEHDIEVALNKYYEESSQKNEADLSAYKQILNGAKLILQQKGFKEDKSLAGKDGIFFRKGDKAVTINYFETNDDVQVMGYDIKEQEDTYINDFRLNKISKLNIEDAVKSAIRSLNESFQKNEAFGGAEMGFSIEKMINCTKQIVNDISGLIENIDDDSIQEYLSKSRINTNEFETCFETLLSYFKKLNELLLLMDKIDIDANDGSKWFRPLAQFVKNRKIG